MPRPDASRWSGGARLAAAATAAYAMILVFATHYPRPEELLGTGLPPDKLLHFVAYGVLGLVATVTLAAAGRLQSRPLALLLVALVAFAAIDEATQPWFGRRAEAWDLAYDLAGVAAGMAAGATVARLVRSAAGRR